MRAAAEMRPARERGLTLTELILATGLASIVVLALLRLIDVSLSLWAKGEEQRSQVEEAGVVCALLARDLRAAVGGPRGDLVAEWAPFDADGDGLLERHWPRLRLVLAASAAELARLARRDEGRSGAVVDVPRRGRIEVAWAVLPAARGEGPAAEGVLWRGERVVRDDDAGSFFAPGFFDGSGRPPAGALDAVGGGCLWLGLSFATQTTTLREGWRIGPALADAAGSWDAWNRARPDARAHEWNTPGAGMPRVDDEALLPRRVRIELELERADARERRTTLLAAMDALQGTLEVANGEALPKEAGAHVLVDAEWMEVLGVSGDVARVARGRRGTAPMPHEPGRTVHWGRRVVTEVPIPSHRDDWNL